MRDKKSLNILAPLLKKPFFTSQDARHLGVSPATLAYYVNTGQLERVSRGIYRGIKAPHSIGLWSDLAETAYSQKGIICLTSALAFYGLTEEIPRQHWIGINHGTSNKPLPNVKTVRFRNTETGRTEIVIDGLRVAIFDKERTIIDAFRLLSRETAIKALKAAAAMRGKNRIDLRKLEAYARQLKFDITPYLLSVTT